MEWLTIIWWALKVIAASLLLALFYLVISYFFLFPKLKIEIMKQKHDIANITTYKIILTNPENSKQDIYNLEFSFRFDEKFPIKNYSLEEINFKSGIMLRSSEDFIISLGEQKVETKILTSALRGATDKFASGTTVAVDVNVDTLYDGSRGDVFPPTFLPNLRENSYYFVYRYRPLGIFSPIFFKKEGYFDFFGAKSKPDDFRNYKQKVRMLNGKEVTIDWGFETKR